MLLAMLSYDAHVASLLGKDPETIFELILMLRDARLPYLSCIYRTFWPLALFPFPEAARRTDQGRCVL